MGELVVPFGMAERLLPTFDHDAFARALAPVLDSGDIKTATKMWLAWRERADRILRRKRIAESVREALLAQLCAAVRLDLYAYRKSPGAPCRAPARSTAVGASVISFRPRAAGGGG